MMQQYPQVLSDDDILEVLRYIVDVRETDITDFNNLPQRFIGGRKVEKVPTGKTDVEATDNEGDINYSIISANYGLLYVLVDNAGTLEWWTAVLQNFPSISAGTFTANGATPVTVTDAAITASSQVAITLKTVGGTVGSTPSVKTITVGVGFTVAGTALDTSVYNYRIS